MREPTRSGPGAAGFVGFLVVAPGALVLSHDRQHVLLNLRDGMYYGLEAVGMVERLSPDVLFLDVQMPGLSGFDVLSGVHAPRDDDARERGGDAGLGEDGFEALRRNVGVVISDDGRRHRAYGLYRGDGVARDNFPDQIIIFRDTLRRDFGHDPDLLRHEVTRTVRHELAHHLGADELGVRDLGL